MQCRTLLYFSPVPWDSYAQRPHYFVRHFLDRPETRVVWIDPHPTRLPALRDVRRLGERREAPTIRPERLTVVSPRTLPLEPLRVGRWLNRRLVNRTLLARLRELVTGSEVRIGIGRPSALAYAALSALPSVASFYDAMDDFPEFYHGISRTSVLEQERRIVSAVDVVVAASTALWNKFADLGARRVLIRNAFEMSALPSLPIARSGERRFGYVGCVGDWFDWATTIRLARTFADVPVHIVGPCFSRPPGDLPSNVRLFPACTTAEAIDHFQTFSVGLIPFKRTTLTAGVDPVKYYGYRGMGLPVLSTPFGEMARRGVADGAFLVTDGAGLEVSARAALGADCDTAAVEAFRREHEWARRFAAGDAFDRALRWAS